MICLSKNEQDLLAGFLAKTLDPARMAELDRHIRECADCRGLAGGLSMAASSEESTAKFLDEATRHLTIAFDCTFVALALSLVVMYFLHTIQRDEESLVASTYADRLPADLTGRDTFVLDPMLATGGTLATVISMLANRGAASITAICLLAAPEGLRHVEAAFAADEVRVVTAAVDERLNEKGYIVPGLGDAGDRLFGQI